jgi:uncharacterized protein YktA (UPF0223 family)
MAKPYKLSFFSITESLKSPIECNSIAQVLLHFNYVERWGNAKTVQENLPEDSKNVIAFFNAIKKMSSDGFQVKKFHELWETYNMTDITDYIIDKPLVMSN